MTINSHPRGFATSQEKEEYIRVKVRHLGADISKAYQLAPQQQEWVHTLARIRSAELENGPLSSTKSFFQDWTPKYDSEVDEDFPTRRGKLEV